MILVCLRCHEQAVDNTKPVRGGCWYCSSYTEVLSCIKCGFKVCVPCAKKLVAKKPVQLGGDIADEGSEI